MITAPALASLARLRHGFLTRRGGVSGGAFASLNCGFGSGDDAECVAANRARALARLGVDGAALVTARQAHSATAIAVEASWPRAAAPEADALVTDRPGLALGVLSADCAPVLLADSGARVIGAVHAGWRGARAGVLEAAVAAMTGLGARTGRIVAAIGPCIQARSYEVGPEFHDRFVAEDVANRGLFAVAGRRGHFLFDLPGYLERRLERLGLAVVEPLGLDTCADEDRFFSYRRAVRRGEAAYGRALSAIALD